MLLLGIEVLLWFRFNYAADLCGAGLFIDTACYAFLFNTALLEFCLTRLLTAGEEVGLLKFLTTDVAGYLDDEACCLVACFGATLTV